MIQSVRKTLHGFFNGIAQVSDAATELVFYPESDTTMYLMGIGVAGVDGIAPGASGNTKVTASLTSLSAGVSVILSEAERSKQLVEDEEGLPFGPGDPVYVHVDEVAGGHSGIQFYLSIKEILNGTGQIAWTYTLTDSVSGLPISDATVQISTDLAGANRIATAQTNASGVASFNLDPGSYYIWRQKAGWTFTNPDLEAVS